MTGNVASVDVPQDAVRQPAVDTRDRSAESVAVTTSRGAAQPVAADGDSMWKMGAIWLAILGAVATLAVVAGLRRREAAGPVSVVRLVPHGRKGS